MQAESTLRSRKVSRRVKNSTHTFLCTQVWLPQLRASGLGGFSRASAKVLEMTFQPPPGLFLAQSSEAPGTCKNKIPSLFLEGTKISGRVNLGRPLGDGFSRKIFSLPKISSLDLLHQDLIRNKFLGHKTDKILS